MQSHWLTLPEIALEKHITVEEAQKLVTERKCPCVFKAAGTVYLVD